MTPNSPQSFFSMDLGQLAMCAHSPIRNYIVSGLTSYLVTMPEEHEGTIRMFHSLREQFEFITPHSHRFNLRCRVLKGVARNITWRPSLDGDLFMHASQTRVPEQFGKYAVEVDQEAPPLRYFPDEAKHLSNTVYSMASTVIHSIFFGRGTWVLVHEGPEVRPTSTLLFPVVDGEVLNTLHTPSWAFQRC